VNRYSETNFFASTKYHTDKVWRNFAGESALGKCIAAGKGPSARVECANIQNVKEKA